MLTATFYNREAIIVSLPWPRLVLEKTQDRHASFPQDRVAPLYAVATLEQPRRFHSVRPLRESRRRTVPAQRLDLLEERRICAQGREFFEKQREIALFVENV